MGSKRSFTTIFPVPLTKCDSSTNNQNKLEETDDLFTFPDGALVDGDNVITIVQVRSLAQCRVATHLHFRSSLGQHGSERNERRSVAPYLMHL